LPNSLSSVRLVLAKSPHNRATSASASPALPIPLIDFLDTWDEDPGVDGVTFGACGLVIDVEVVMRERALSMIAASPSCGDQPRPCRKVSQGQRWTHTSPKANPHLQQTEPFLPFKPLRHVLFAHCQHLFRPLDQSAYRLS